MQYVLSLFVLLCMLGMAFPVIVAALMLLVASAIRYHWQNRKFLSRGRP